MIHTRDVRKDQIILYQGEATRYIYRVIEGIVRAYTIQNNGEESIVAFYGPGDYFPVGVAYDKAPGALFYYETMTAGTLELYLTEDFTNVILKDAANELDKAAARYISAVLHINALAQASAMEKIMHVLRFLAMRFGVELNGGVYTRIDIRLTQQDIAKLCNTSRETSSIELKKLKEKDVVVERNKFYAVNLAKLNKLIGDEGIVDARL